MAALAAATLLGACGGGSGGGGGFIGFGGLGSPPAPEPPPSAGTVKVLSNRADLVSAGDALVEVVARPGADASQFKVALGGADVTAAFAVRDNGRFMGLLSGLAAGPNQLTASLPDGSVATATITNHSNAGAILYGPQIQPWQCDAGAIDMDCNRPASYAFKYASSNPAVTALLPYDPANPPGDVGTTVTDEGRAVPFIVRIETGVQDRDYYNIAVLFDPASPWTAWSPQPGWNRKVFIVHGGGCGNGYAQTNAQSSVRVLDRTQLSRGFAVLSISLNDSGHNCNLAVQAEATMMAKEHVIENYGEIRYTYGFGGSGGAAAQLWMANAYPGLYDGVIAAFSFADITSQGLEVEDCALMLNYFGRTALPWTDAQKAAAAGHVTPEVCKDWVTNFGFQNNFDPYATHLVNLPGNVPTVLGGCDAPAHLKYDATFNPTGVRCTAWDSAASVFGKNAAGAAHSLFSNVGVQYGLSALLGGTISADQFVDLNTAIGSHTLDYVFQSRRVTTSADAVAAGYRSGFINQANGLGRVAILDYRVPDITGIHHQFRSWMIRARLDKTLGGHANQAIWYAAGSPVEAYGVMDAWLAAIEQDQSARPIEQKVVANRPAAANDRCDTRDGAGLSISQCTGTADSSPRVASGAAQSDDVFLCQLKPLDRAGYGSATFTDAQWSRLQGAFPSGVCDHGKPGVGQQPVQFWQTYLKPDRSVIVGGAALPPAP